MPQYCAHWLLRSGHEVNVVILHLSRTIFGFPMDPLLNMRTLPRRSRDPTDCATTSPPQTPPIKARCGNHNSKRFLNIVGASHGPSAQYTNHASPTARASRLCHHIALPGSQAGHTIDAITLHASRYLSGPPYVSSAQHTHIASVPSGSSITCHTHTHSPSAPFWARARRRKFLRS